MPQQGFIKHAADQDGGLRGANAIAKRAIATTNSRKQRINLAMAIAKPIERLLG
ncbi:MAG: hypothetical protein SFY66_14270 [Oculatellaceae cyanobacterium bins.114]|nr:hypothetical protein [Oculatellaceae cyanobacterium bins.114]